jgi:hypothetical protein
MEARNLLRRKALNRTQVSQNDSSMQQWLQEIGFGMADEIVHQIVGMIFRGAFSLLASILVSI